MQNGIKIWGNPQYFKVELAETLLHQNGIASFVMDKRDSSYPGILGEVELYVEADDAERAKEILEDNEVDK